MSVEKTDAEQAGCRLQRGVGIRRDDGVSLKERE